MEGCSKLHKLQLSVGFTEVSRMSPVYKIITIRQPWASLIVHGFKDIENRSWARSYRGPVLVRFPASERSFGRRRRATIRHRSAAARIAARWNRRHHEYNRLCRRALPALVRGPIGFVLDGSRTLPFKPWKGSLGLRSATTALVGALGLLLESYQMRLAVT